MNVDINLLGSNVKVDKVGWQLLSRQHTRIGLQYCLVEVRMTHISPVDKEELLRLLRCRFGFTHKTMNTDQFGLLLNFQQLRCEQFALALAKHAFNTLFERADRQIVQYLVIRYQRKRHLGIHQHNVLKGRNQVSQFCLVGFQEPAASRYVEEQVLHLYARACGALAGFLSLYIRSRNLQKRANLVRCAACGHLHLRYGTYTRQRLTAKTHRSQMKQILCLTYLRCRMTLKRHTRIRDRHPCTIINDLDERLTGIAYQHAYSVSARIQRVLHQLLQARCRSLNDLTRRNLVGYTIR